MCESYKWYNRAALVSGDDMKSTRVSVIVINHNYGQFVRDAIESCLEQSYNNVETIVVDDGSTDNSQQVIRSFGNKIASIFQANLGMMQAANKGFSLSTGNIVIFLDADDYLLKECVERVVNCWREGTSKVHYRLQMIDKNGNNIDVFPPRDQKLGQGEVWKEIMSSGRYTTPPTSGNAFSRTVLERIFPVRDARIGQGEGYYDYLPTDAYLKLRVPFYGPVLAIDEVLGNYRIHGCNSGAENSPYVHRGKRQRLLRLAKKNSEFIQKEATAMKLAWDEDVLFRYGKYLKLRVLSLRFDGACHPWPKDTRVVLLKKAWRNLDSGSVNKTGRKMYDFLVVGLLCALPHRMAIGILKVIH